MTKHTGPAIRLLAYLTADGLHHGLNEPPLREPAYVVMTVSARHQPDGPNWPHLNHNPTDANHSG
jgi:hypothetical protein